jgi:hypothetical protein
LSCEGNAQAFFLTQTVLSDLSAVIVWYEMTNPQNAGDNSPSMHKIFLVIPTSSHYVADNGSTSVPKQEITWNDLETAGEQPVAFGTTTSGRIAQLNVWAIKTLPVANQFLVCAVQDLVGVFGPQDAVEYWVLWCAMYKNENGQKVRLAYHVIDEGVEPYTPLYFPNYLMWNQQHLPENTIAYAKKIDGQLGVQSKT